MAAETHDYDDYLSTACRHGLHDRCQLTCKFCGEPCCCPCHEKQEAKPAPETASTSPEVPPDEPRAGFPSQSIRETASPRAPLSP